MPTTSELAAELYDELGSPVEFSVSSITNWLNNNLPKLNNQLETEYLITDDIDDVPAVIFKLMYEIYFYGYRASQLLGAGGANQVLEVQSDGGVVRLVNKNELAKTFLALKKDLLKELQDAINTYKVHNKQDKAIAGEDRDYPILEDAGKFVRDIE